MGMITDHVVLVHSYALSYVLKDFAIFTGKHLCWSLFFIEVVGLRACNLTKKSFQHRCFLVNIAKFSGTVFFYRAPPMAASESFQPNRHLFA